VHATNTLTELAALPSDWSNDRAAIIAGSQLLLEPQPIRIELAKKAECDVDAPACTQAFARDAQRKLSTTLKRRWHPIR